MKIFVVTLMVDENQLGVIMAHALERKQGVAACKLLERAVDVRPVVKPVGKPKAKKMKAKSDTLVLEAIRQGNDATGEPDVSRNVLAQRCSDLSYRTVDSAVHRLKVQGKIEAVGKGVYRIRTNEAST